MHDLNAYQSEIARAVVDSVLRERGLTFTVEIARGDGLTHVNVPSGDEGFLRGVLLLTGFAGPATHSATEEPETALAS
jgi:hypothetical protein